MLCVAALATLAGCTAWHSRGSAAQPALSDHPADRVRVTLTDGTIMIVRSPVAVGDTLFGWITASRTDSTRVALPGARIRNIETHDVDLWRTGGVLFLAGSIALTALVLSLVIVLVQAAR